MNAKQYLASATVASLLACAMPAGAQVLGGNLAGSLEGSWSGVGGLGGLGRPTSIATGTLRDLNGMAHATTTHAHDTVDSVTINADRAAARVDEHTQALGATANAASSAASSVDTRLPKTGDALTPDSKAHPLEVPASTPSRLHEEPVKAASTKTAPQDTVTLPTASVSSDISAASRASSGR